jgi:hypothetical protein
MRWSGSLCGRKGRRERRGQRRRQRRQRRRRWRRRPRRRRRQQRHRWGIRLRAGDAQQGERHEEKDDARESRRGSEAAHRAAPRRGSARHTSGAYSAHGRRLHDLERLREKRCEFYRNLMMTRTTFRIFKSKRGTITFPKMCTSGSGDRGNRSNYLRTFTSGCWRHSWSSTYQKSFSVRGRGGMRSAKVDRDNQMWGGDRPIGGFSSLFT